MKIFAYTALTGYYTRPTGVGKHMDQMFHGLARTHGFDLSVLTAQSELPPGGVLPSTHPLSDLPLIPLPYKRRRLEWSWMLLGRPSIDQWCPDADWIYTGYEVPIRTRLARLAATIHSLYWFDPECPQYNSWGFRKARLRHGPVFRYIARRADRIFTVSEFLKRQIVDWLHVAPQRITVVGNGVEREYYDVSRQLRGLSGRPKDQPYILCVGGLNDLDGAAYILDVAEQLKERKSEIQVLIAGTQNDAHYVSRANSLGNVELLGYTDKACLSKLMRDSVALLYLNRYESFGMAAAEAMAAGTPVIGTNFTAVPEVIGSAGVIADVNKPQEIAQTIVDFSQEDALRQRYIEYGYARAKQFTWDVCVARLAGALA